MSNEHDHGLAAQFESHRERLRTVAYRMLGSLSEAEDAAQEAWLRLAGADAHAIANLGGWLTTVVARLCLDRLRSRRLRAEAPLTDAASPTADSVEGEVELADAVGLALLVVLDTLAPAERVAFVLHDMFDVAFEEIAPIVERTPVATRQLASRARRRVQGAPVPGGDRQRQRAVVDAFLAAARGGDVGGLVALLDPNAVLRGDRISVPVAGHVVHGAEAIARRVAAAGARAARPMLLDGEVGVVVAPLGRLRIVLRYTIIEDKIVAIDAIGEPERLGTFELALVD